MTYPDTPANRVIEAFSGPRALGRAIGLHHSWVVRWRREPPEGTGGLIPSRHHRKILRAARERGLDITADDLIGD